MIRDRIMAGVAVGLLADIIKLGLNFTGYLLNFTPVVFWQIAATRFLEKDQLGQPLAYLIGGVADATVSSLLGVAFLYFITYYGGKYLWIKGIGFGLVTWVGLFGTLLSQSVQTKLPQSGLGILVTLLAHLFFGLSLAFFTRLLGLSKGVTREEQPDHKQKSLGFHFRWVPAPAKKDAKKIKKYRKPTKIN